MPVCFVCEKGKRNRSISFPLFYCCSAFDIRLAAFLSITFLFDYNISVSDPEERALLVGTGEAGGVHPDGALPGGFSPQARDG